VIEPTSIAGLLVFHTEPWDRRAVAWDDPDLAVSWPVDVPAVSDDDRANPTLRERFPDHPSFSPTSKGSA
jgi:dTDP-4-dehydrorhamnose 3,5-epimerase-like enzyme